MPARLRHVHGRLRRGAGRMRTESSSGWFMFMWLFCEVSPCSHACSAPPVCTPTDTSHRAHLPPRRTRPGELGRALHRACVAGWGGFRAQRVRRREGQGAQRAHHRRARLAPERPNKKEGWAAKGTGFLSLPTPALAPGANARHWVAQAWRGLGVGTRDRLGSRAFVFLGLVGSRPACGLTPPGSVVCARPRPPQPPTPASSFLSHTRGAHALAGQGFRCGGQGLAHRRGTGD